MNRLTRISLGVATILMLMGLGDHWTARAQVPGPGPGAPPYRRPAVSPYLDLAGTRGNAAAFMLYQRVQPRLQFQNSIQNLQQQINVTQSEVAQAQTATTLPGTGHATMFMNLGGYFQSSGGALKGGSQRSAITPSGVPPQRTTRSTGAAAGTRRVPGGGR